MGLLTRSKRNSRQTKWTFNHRSIVASVISTGDGRAPAQGRQKWNIRDKIGEIIVTTHFFGQNIARIFFRSFQFASKSGIYPPRDSIGIRLQLVTCDRTRRRRRRLHRRHLLLHKLNQRPRNSNIQFRETHVGPFKMLIQLYRGSSNHLSGNQPSRRQIFQQHIVIGHGQEEGRHNEPLRLLLRSLVEQPTLGIGTEWADAGVHSSQHLAILHGQHPSRLRAERRADVDANRCTARRAGACEHVL
mmetsp:Transcript_3735/g.8663  ORF Transcript_3735/g.8663 Transcript_3735/m.8663 type:complete len:245 (-) Transcript_3735:303-1037(-)